MQIRNKYYFYLKMICVCCLITSCQAPVDVIKETQQTPPVTPQKEQLVEQVAAQPKTRVVQKYKRSLKNADKQVFGWIEKVTVGKSSMMLKAKAETNNLISGTTETISESFSPHINLGISVLIPDTYIPDVELRLGLYRRIAMQHTAQDIEAIAVEMVDRFGKLPKEVENLLEVMKLKLLCVEANISKIESGPKGVVVTFHENRFHNPEALITFVTKHPTRTKLRGDQKLVLLEQWETSQEKFSGMKQTIHTILSLKAA